MGAEQSKHAYTGGSNKLGSGPASSNAAPGYQEREAMAEAAQRRAKATKSSSPPSRSPKSSPALTPAPTSSTSSPAPGTSYDPAHPSSPSGLVPAPQPNMTLSEITAAVPTPSGREAIAEAAERRAKAAQARGTHVSNPRRGELASKAGKLNKTPTPTSEPERLIYE